MEIQRVPTVTLRNEPGNDRLPCLRGMVRPGGDIKVIGYVHTTNETHGASEVIRVLDHERRNCKDGAVRICHREEKQLFACTKYLPPRLGPRARHERERRDACGDQCIPRLRERCELALYHLQCIGISVARFRIHGVCKPSRDSQRRLSGHNSRWGDGAALAWRMANGKWREEW